MLRRAVPDRDAVVDLAFAAVLVSIALLGLRTGFLGVEWVVAAWAGLVLGLAVGHLAAVFRWMALTTLLVLAAVYLLLGGPLAVRDSLVVGVVPTPQTFVDLATWAVTGWKQWLTLLPPVDARGPVLALPWLAGLLGGALTLGVARRWASVPLSALAPLGLLAASIALGTLEPAAVLVQGVGFAAVLVGWLVVRSHRTRAPIQNGAGARARVITGAGLAVVALLGGFFAGPLLPGYAAAERREVVRTALVPPFDVSQYPSPLPGYRQYTEPNDADLYDEVVLRVRGLPQGQVVRFATLDRYDGLVWGAADRSADGVPFQQVGSRIAASGRGTPVEVEVSVPDGGYRGTWLPTVGAPTRIEFDGPRADDLAGALWLNTDTDTAIVPAGLVGGETYRMAALVRPRPPPSCPRTSTWPRAPRPASTSTSSTPGSMPGRAAPREAPGPSCGPSRPRCAPRARTPTVAPRTASRRSTCPGTPCRGSPGSSGRASSRATTSSTRPRSRWSVSASASRPASSWGRCRRRAATCAARTCTPGSRSASVTARGSRSAADTFVPSRDKTPSEQQLRTEEQQVGAQVPPPAGVSPPSVLQGPDQAQNATDVTKRKKSPFDVAAWPLWLKILVVRGARPAAPRRAVRPGAAAAQGAPPSAPCVPRAGARPGLVGVARPGRRDPLARGGRPAWSHPARTGRRHRRRGRGLARGRRSHAGRDGRGRRAPRGRGVGGGGRGGRGRDRVRSRGRRPCGRHGGAHPGRGGPFDDARRAGRWARLRSDADPRPLLVGRERTSPAPGGGVCGSAPRRGSAVPSQQIRSAGDQGRCRTGDRLRGEPRRSIMKRTLTSLLAASTLTAGVIAVAPWRPRPPAHGPPSRRRSLWRDLARQRVDDLPGEGPRPDEVRRLELGLG